MVSNLEPYDPAIVERSARAVAAPGDRASFIAADNGSFKEFAEIRVAARSGRPFMVRCRKGTLPGDADSEETGRLVEGAIAAMERDGLQPVIIASGRPGHRHLFVRIDDPALYERWERWASENKIDTRKGVRWIRPPLSPHRLGLEVRLIYPATVEEALARLEPRRGTPKSTTAIPTVPGRTARLLKHGMSAEPGRYKSRSELIMAIVQGLVNKGSSFAEIVSELRKPTNAGAEKVQQMTERKADEYLLVCYRKALQRQRPAFHDATDALRAIDEIEAGVKPCAFPGRCGPAEFAVMRACIEIARLRKSPTFGASVREVAERAKIHRATVQRALERLVTAGRLLRAAGWSSKKATSANEWTLRNLDGRKLVRQSSFMPPHEGLTVSVTSAGHDVFRNRGGLGKATELVWRLCDRRVGRTTTEIAAERGITSRAVRFHLRKLRNYRLTALDRNGRWRQTDRDLDELARELGVANATAIQKRRHEEDRMDYLEKLYRRSCAVAQRDTGEVSTPVEPFETDIDSICDGHLITAEELDREDREQAESQVEMQ